MVGIPASAVAAEDEAPMAVDRISISVDMNIVATALDLEMVRASLTAAGGGISRRPATSDGGGTWLEPESGIVCAGF